MFFVHLWPAVIPKASLLTAVPLQKLLDSTPASRL